MSGPFLSLSIFLFLLHPPHAAPLPARKSSIYVRVHAAFYYLNLPLPAKIQRDLRHDLVLCAVSLKFN